MISMEDLVRATRLAPSVGPFTIRRLMFRAGIFASDGFSVADVQRARPAIEAELQEILSPADRAAAQRDLTALLAAESSGAS
jgi:hypothetical protein